MTSRWVWPPMGVVMRTDYRSLEVAEHVNPAFDRFLSDFCHQLNDPNVDNYTLVCETIYELETGEKGYQRALEKALEQKDLAAQMKLVSMNPRYAAQEPEYYGDIDLERYERNKPLHWMWTYFDRLAIGRNTLIGFPFRRILGAYMFAFLGENVKIFHNVEFTYGYNLFIEDNVVIQSGCKIGLRGFGFIPNNDKNIKMPHIGRVIIEKNADIASGCTIDRGSVSDTIIGKNTYLDNQVHIAHNVQIGKNCMIAGQVGFAGSCTIGNNVSIGGQAGISGHLKIGNNVKIGGGSGVVKDIEDNQIVMGYPAVPLKEFLKKN